MPGLRLPATALWRSCAYETETRWFAAALSLTTQIMVHWCKQSKVCTTKHFVLLGTHAFNNNMVTSELRTQCFGLHTWTNPGHAASISALDFPGRLNSTTVRPAQCRCIC